MAKRIDFQLNPLSTGFKAKILSPKPIFREIPIDLLKFDPDQPRKSFNEETLGQLAESIREVGVLSPILVRELDDGSYLVVSGERRVRGATLAGLKTIPAVVTEKANEPADKMVVQIIENLQRENLKPLERATAFAVLRDEYKLSVREIARKTGVSKSQVQRSLQLLELPQEFKKLLEQGVSESKVLELAKLKAPQAHLASKPREYIRDIRLLASISTEVTKLAQELFGNLATVRKAKKKYEIAIRFPSEDDLLKFLKKCKVLKINISG
ncbi:MAG: ParB/RepB/Spo0J family partition protein [Deltaproteobacteria bacterium]|nr:ParB/RepB/Spo0J family partition protein [Deltaproteobacteria bacterium]MCX7953089.1 ParB/RepB/Spo0J family partition protein [Deltaproteobacteria bacterium]